MPATQWRGDPPYGATGFKQSQKKKKPRCFLFQGAWCFERVSNHVARAGPLVFVNKEKTRMMAVAED
jgi:hypothetical protein